VPWSWKRESAREDHRNDKVCCVYCSRLCVRVGFVDDGADPSALRTDSISDGRDRREPLSRRVRAGLDRAGFLLRAQPGPRRRFSTRSFFSNRYTANLRRTFAVKAASGHAKYGPEAARRKLDSTRRLKPQRRSMHHCVHAVGHEARKCQHQWRCTTKCKKDLGGNPQQGSLVGDTG